MLIGDCGQGLSCFSTPFTSNSPLFLSSAKWSWTSWTQNSGQHWHYLTSFLAWEITFRFALVHTWHTNDKQPEKSQKWKFLKHIYIKAIQRNWRPEKSSLYGKGQMLTWERISFSTYDWRQWPFMLRFLSVFHTFSHRTYTQVAFYRE